MRATRISLLFLFTLFDQFPEAGVLLQLFIFRHREFRTKKEIPDGVFVQDPVYKYALRAALEVDPVIVGSITIETFSFPLDHAESLGIEAVQDRPVKTGIRRATPVEVLLEFWPFRPR